MPYHFGFGRGRMSKAEQIRRAIVADRHGAKFVAVHGEQGHCVCGHGCRLDTCPVLRYWFVSPNLGEPFDSAVRRAVESDLAAGR